MITPLMVLGAFVALFMAAFVVSAGLYAGILVASHYWGAIRVNINSITLNVRRESDDP